LRRLSLGVKKGLLAEQKKSERGSETRIKRMFHAWERGQLGSPSRRTSALKKNRAERRGPAGGEREGQKTSGQERGKRKNRLRGEFRSIFVVFRSYT